tara:strand:- start:169 stop:351 length:183 start_codon:yes stop_codon:yes gene_type:complete
MIEECRDIASKFQQQADNSQQCLPRLRRTPMEWGLYYEGKAHAYLAIALMLEGCGKDAGH